MKISEICAKHDIIIYNQKKHDNSYIKHLTVML